MRGATRRGSPGVWNPCRRLSRWRRSTCAPRCCSTGSTAPTRRARCASRSCSPATGRSPRTSCRKRSCGSRPSSTRSRDPAAFGAYLTRAVANLAKSHFRHQQVAQRHTRTVDASSLVVDPVDVATNDALLVALRRLPVQQRAALGPALLQRPLARGDRAGARLPDRHREVAALPRPGPPAQGVPGCVTRSRPSSRPACATSAASVPDELEPPADLERRVARRRRRATHVPRLATLGIAAAIVGAVAIVSVVDRAPDEADHCLDERAAIGRGRPPRRTPRCSTRATRSSWRSTRTGIRSRRSSRPRGKVVYAQLTRDHRTLWYLSVAGQRRSRLRRARAGRHRVRVRRRSSATPSRSGSVPTAHASPCRAATACAPAPGARLAVRDLATNEFSTAGVAAVPTAISWSPDGRAHRDEHVREHVRGAARVRRAAHGSAPAARTGPLDAAGSRRSAPTACTCVERNLVDALRAARHSRDDDHGARVTSRATSSGRADGERHHGRGTPLGTPSSEPPGLSGSRAACSTRSVRPSHSAPCRRYPGRADPRSKARPGRRRMPRDVAEVAGIEPTGRGVPVPLVLKTRRATRPRSPPGRTLSPGSGEPRRAISRRRFRRPTKPAAPPRRVGGAMDDGHERRSPLGPADFDDTFRRWYGPMVRILAVAAGDREVAADCVQEAFIARLRALAPGLASRGSGRLDTPRRGQPPARPLPSSRARIGGRSTGCAPQTPAASPPPSEPSELARACSPRCRTQQRIAAALVLRRRPERRRGRRRDGPERRRREVPPARRRAARCARHWSTSNDRRTATIPSTTRSARVGRPRPRRVTSTPTRCSAPCGRACSGPGAVIGSPRSRWSWRVCSS